MTDETTVQIHLFSQEDALCEFRFSRHYIISAVNLETGAEIDPKDIPVSEREMAWDRAFVNFDHEN